MSVAFEDIRVGAVLRLDAGDPELPLPGSRKIPKGRFLVKAVRLTFCHPPWGKPEHDMVAEMVKVSKAGKEIGNYRYVYTVDFFMRRAFMEKP